MCSAVGKALCLINSEYCRWFPTAEPLRSRGFAERKKIYKYMLTENLAVLFERDILKLKTEINAYADETKLWITIPGTSNSGGNLCLHLLGNLQHYIGALLGGNGYIRNRPEEFSQKDIPVSVINATIDHTIQVVTKTICSLSPEKLNGVYPEKVLDKTFTPEFLKALQALSPRKEPDDSFTTEYFLLHLLAHLDYHLGQINYHRRIVEARR